MVKPLLITCGIMSVVMVSGHADLVAHYTFDNAGDLGANSVSGTLDWNNFASITQTTGRFGAGAGSFTAGSSSAWDNNFNVGNLNQFSLSMHVKSSQTAAWDDFVSIGTGVSTVLVMERTGAEGVFVYNIGNVGGTASTSEGQVGYAPGNTIFDVDDGTWHHLGITVGGGTLSLYIDGVNRGSAAYSGSGGISAFQLASRFGDATRAITTEIDDVAVYNETLSDAQMSWLSSNAATASPIPEPGSLLLIMGAATWLTLTRLPRNR